MVFFSVENKYNTESFCAIMSFHTHKQMNFLNNMVMGYDVFIFEISLAHVAVKPTTFAILAQCSKNLS